MPSKILTEGNRYKAHLKALLADRKVTRAEAKALAKQALAPGFTQVKAFYLAGFVARNSDRFEAGAAALVNKALARNAAVIEGEVGRRRTGGPTSDPSLAPEDVRRGNVRYEARSGALAVGGMGADDVLQGELGDCYLLASLSAVAQARPELLAKNVKTHRDGTYTVTFYERPDMRKPAKPVQVTVDGDFATRAGALEYVSAREARELWPLVYEKAYAKWKGGYGAIEGGMGSMALEALTGAKPTYTTITSDADPKVVFREVKAACARGGCVVALSQPYGSDVAGMVEDHAYTVLGTEERGGKQYVRLRNPWGEKEPGRDGRDDGIFTLSAEDFTRAFAMVESVRP